MILSKENNCKPETPVFDVIEKFAYCELKFAIQRAILSRVSQDICHKTDYITI